MKRGSIVAALLIAVFVTSAFACVLGSGADPACAPAVHRDACVRRGGSSDCGPRLKAAPSRCSLRGLAQIHFAALPLSTFAIAAPLQVAKASSRSERPLSLSSVGLPETDRGPPLS